MRRRADGRKRRWQEAQATFLKGDMFSSKFKRPPSIRTASYPVPWSIGGLPSPWVLLGTGGTRSANSHTGRRLSSCRIQGRTDDSIRPRAQRPQRFPLAWKGASTDGEPTLAPDLYATNTGRAVEDLELCKHAQMLSSIGPGAAAEHVEGRGTRRRHRTARGALRRSRPPIRLPSLGDAWGGPPL